MSGLHGGKRKWVSGDGGVVLAKGRVEVMKRGFVPLWATLGFSREFSHVAANSAAGSFLFLHSEQRLNINQRLPPTPSQRKRWPLGFRPLKNNQHSMFALSLTALSRSLSYRPVARLNVWPTTKSGSTCAHELLHFSCRLRRCVTIKKSP